MQSHLWVCLQRNDVGVILKSSLVVLEAWPWPRGSSRTPRDGLGLGHGLGWQGLGLGLGLGFERKVVALALPRPRLFPKTQEATWLLYVYALLTLTESH